MAQKQTTIEIKIETNQKELKTLNSEIGKLNKDLDSVNDSLRQYSEGSKAFTKEEIDAMKKRQKMLKDEVKFNEKRTTEIKEEIGLISKLEKKMADLNQAKRLATSVEEIASLNEELSETEAQLAEISTTGESLGDSLSNTPGIIGQISTSVSGLFQLFKANPVILALTLIVGALKMIYDAFVQTEEGANVMSETFAYLSSLFAPFTKMLQDAGKWLVKLFKDPLPALEELGKSLVDNIITRIKGLMRLFPALAKAIVQAFKLDFEGATKTVGDVLGEIVLGTEDFTKKLADASDEANRLAKMVSKLKKAENDLEKSRRKEDVSRAKRLKDVEKLKNIRDDESKSIKDRQAANEAIIKIQDEQLRDEVAIAEEQLRINEEKLEQQRQGVTLWGTEKEILDDIVAAKIEVYQVETDIAGFQNESTMNRIALLKDEFTQFEILNRQQEANALIFTNSEEEKYKISVKFQNMRIAKLRELGLTENEIYKQNLAEGSLLTDTYIQQSMAKLKTLANGLSNVFGVDTITDIEAGINRLATAMDGLTVGRFTENGLEEFDMYGDTVVATISNITDKIQTLFDKVTDENSEMTSEMIEAEMLKLSDFGTIWEEVSEKFRIDFNKMFEFEVNWTSGLEDGIDSLSDKQRKAFEDLERIAVEKRKLLQANHDLAMALLEKDKDTNLDYLKDKAELERKFSNTSYTIELDLYEKKKKLLAKSIQELKAANKGLANSWIGEFNALGAAIENAFDPNSILAFGEALTTLGNDMEEFLKKSQLTAKEFAVITASAIELISTTTFSQIAQAREIDDNEKMASIEENNRTEELALKDKLDFNELSQREYQESTEKLEDQTYKKKNRLMEMAFIAQQKNDVAQTAMNTSVALIKAIAQLGPILGPISGGIIGAMGAIQIGMINSKRYVPLARARGGIIPQNGEPTNRDSVPAMLAPGEFVMNSESTRMFEPILNEMNGAGAGDSVAVTPPALALKEAKSDTPVVKAYVSEVDITTTQNRVSSIDDEASF